MKKSYCCLVGLIAFISSLCLYSCTSDSDEPRGGGADKEKIEMQVAVYPVKTGEAVDRLLPRMIATTDGWTITELYDGNHPRSMIYHICKGDESLSALMMAEGDYLWLMQYDNARNTTQNDAMLVKAESDGSATVLTGVFDSGANTFGQSGVARIDMSRSVASAGVLQASQYDDGFDDVRELVLERLINPIAEAHEKLGKLDIKSLKPYVSTMKKVVIPVMKLHLYSNNPDKLSEISGDYIADGIEEYDISPLLPPVAEDMYSLYKGARKAYELHKKWKVNQEDADMEDIDPDWLNVRLSDIVNRYSAVTDVTFEVYKNRIDGTLSCRVSDVKTTSATLAMSASVTGFVTESGYVVYGISGKKTYPASTSASFVLDGLESGVEYHAYAYAIVGGVEVKSDLVSFRTLAEVKISRESLCFDLAGGTEKVEITLPSDKWQWAVGSNPSWCKVSEKGKTLTVKVSSSATSREGDIVLFVYAPDGDAAEYTVKVLQTNMSYMTFKGKLRISSGDVVQDTDYMYMLQRKGNSYVILGGGCPVSQIMFSNWTIGNKKPEPFAESNTNITSFGVNTSGQVITIKGTTANGANTTEFKVVMDLSAGNIMIDDTGTEVTNGKKTITRAVGTLSLVPIEDLM